MAEVRRALVIGPSSVPYTESGDEGRMANLMLTELRSLDPQREWRTTGVQVFQGPGMLERIRAAVEAHTPEVIIVRLGTYQLTNEYVLWRVRDRWPALYPAANSNFIVPTYGTLLAAVSFDQTGTTKIGKWLLNHSFMLPGLVTMVSAIVIAWILSTMLL